MKCKECLNTVSNQKHLICVDCDAYYHVQCLANIKPEDYEFLVSSQLGWKCPVCEKKKILKGDSTPVTPLSGKVFDFKPSGSEADSESNLSDQGVSKKVLCGFCKKGFSHNSHRATCVKCDFIFHFKCISDQISKEEYNKNKSVWQCKSCIDLMLSADKTGKPGDVTMAIILSEMRAFRKEVNQTNKEFADNQSKYGEWLEESNKKIAEVTRSVNDILSKIDDLYQENANLKKTVKELTIKVDYLEQASKEKMLEIHGVPLTRNENVLELVEKVADAIGFTFDQNKIDNCYRVRTSRIDKPGGIYVKFVRKLDMQQFLEHRRNKRNLNSRDIGFIEGEASVIYVNESLTTANRKLLNAARQVKRDKQFTFLWVKNGRIHMRKNEGDRFVVITCMEDLAKIE